MSLTARSLFALAAFFLLLSFVFELAPARESSDLDQFQRYTGNDPWTLGGVRPGDSLAAHEARLGPPEPSGGGTPGGVLRWSRPEELSLVADPLAGVVEVFGQTLKAGGKTLVYPGLSQAEVERILGRGKVTRSTRPTGSGVISIGSKEVARILTYDNGGVRFEITLEEDQVRHIRAVKANGGR